MVVSTSSVGRLTRWRLEPASEITLGGNGRTCGPQRQSLLAYPIPLEAKASHDRVLAGLETPPASARGRPALRATITRTQQHPTQLSVTISRSRGCVARRADP